MDIVQLRTVIHVADLGSLSKAADRLRIAQPALSRQVRLLEEELGVRLFERHGRGMVMTEAGESVLRYAHNIMGELQNIRAAVTDVDAPLSGHVSVGMPPTVSDILSVPLADAFKSRHPDATVRIVSAYSGFLLDWLQRGEVDLAILFGAKTTRSVRSTSLLEEELCLVGSENEALCPTHPVPFKVLEGMTMLLPSPGHGLRGIVERCAQEADITLKIRVEADSYSILKDLVRTRHGMTILPLAPIRDEIASGELTYTTLISPKPLRKLTISYPADRSVTRLTRFAGDILEQTAKTMISESTWVGKLLSPDDQ